MIDKIAAIGKVELTPECKAKINAALTMYELLSEDQKKLVTNVEILTKAEADYKTLEDGGTIGGNPDDNQPGDDKNQQEADKKAAQAVIDKIAAIGKVAYTAQSKSLIDQARAAYNALTAAQKALVNNYNLLTAAEASYQQLQVQADNAAVKGKVYGVSGYSYKVTDVNKKTVTVVGITNKNSKKIKVGNTVKIGNITFKITDVGASAFKNCKKATSATVGANVKTIGANAFAGCKNLKSVKISSKNLTSIGKKAFFGDGSLKTITIKSAKLKKVGAKAFSGINKKAKIKVPAKKLKAYKKLLKNKGQKKSVKITK